MSQAASKVGDVGGIAGAVSADAYLSVVGKKQGTVKGESQTPGHVDEIGVLGWRWGVRSPSDQSTGQAAGRRVYDYLEIDKLVDRASTSLLNALANNESLKSVKLGLRKAGVGNDDFFIFELTNARLVASAIRSSPTGGLYETIAFAYQQISVEYHPQQATGDRGGASSFEDDWYPSDDS